MYDHAWLSLFQSYGLEEPYGSWVSAFNYDMTRSIPTPLGWHASPSPPSILPGCPNNLSVPFMVENVDCLQPLFSLRVLRERVRKNGVKMAVEREGVEKNRLQAVWKIP